MSRRVVSSLLIITGAGVLTYLLLAPRTTVAARVEGENKTTLTITRWGLAGYKIEESESSAPAALAGGSGIQVVNGQFRQSNRSESSTPRYGASIAAVAALWLVVALTAVLLWRRRRGGAS